MNNLAISLFTSDYFTRGLIYETTGVYNGMIDICSQNKGSFITHGADDKGFIFILNPTDEIVRLLKAIYDFYEYK